MGSAQKSTLTDTIDSIFNDQASSHFKSRPSIGGVSNRELEVALTVVLVDLASCDQNFEPREYQVISSGLKRMFGTSKSEVQALVNQANMVLANLRGTNHFAKMLRDGLSIEQKKAVLETIDEIIHIDGQEDGFEIYLRNKFSRLLGLE